MMNMNEMSNKIFEKEKMYIEKLFLKEDLNKKIDEVELQTEYSVLEERELETGKKKYSNEVVRKKEEKNRLYTNNEYIDCIKKISELDKEIRLIQLEIEQMKREWQIIVIESQIRNKPEVI